MKKITMFIPLLIIAFICYCAVSPIVATGESISGKVLRLHILANSDSVQDQALKLKVRDEVLNASNQVFQGCNCLTEAVAAARNHREYLRQTALKALEANNSGYTVKVTVVDEYYDTREYDDFALPAGIYKSVKIIIGEGRGHNWWCVMFPSVCLSGCTEDFSETLTQEELEMIRERKYIVKFKAVEIVEKIKSKFS